MTVVVRAELTLVQFTVAKLSTNPMTDADPNQSRNHGSDQPGNA